MSSRSSKMRKHGGDVAFPGGKREMTDRDEVDTCLRESEEEIQLPRDKVEILAKIPGMVTRFGVYVAPIIGIIPDDFQGVPSEEVEVCNLFTRTIALYKHALVTVSSIVVPCKSPSKIYSLYVC